MPLQSQGTGAVLPPRLLLVEDEVDIAAVVQEVLEPEGYDLTFAATLTAATTLLRQDSFDLVLCDGLSSNPAVAWENALTVLGLAGETETPVALFTAHRPDPDAARAAGFRAIIEKPFDLETFRSQVGALLGR